MGIHDRDYYREDEQNSGFRIRRPQTVVVWLIIINVAAFVVNMLFGGGGGDDGNIITNAMALQGDLVQRPWMFYTLLTSGFAHSPSSLLHIIMNMWGLFLFGRRLETKYGSMEFLAIYLGAILFSGAVWVAAVQLQYLPYLGESDLVWPTAIGASGGVVAVTILYCINWPKDTFLLFGIVPTPAWVIGAIVVGSDLMRMFGGGEGSVAWQAHLGGAAFGAMVFFTGIRITDWLPTNLISGKWFRSKPQLRVHHPDDEALSEADYARLDEEGDRLVAKAAELGAESLTAFERKKLEDYSRRMRQKHR